MCQADVSEQGREGLKAREVSVFQESVGQELESVPVASFPGAGPIPQSPGRACLGFSLEDDLPGGSDFDPLQALEGALVSYLETAQGEDPVLVELDADRRLRLGREDIHQGSANRVFSLIFHHRASVVTCAQEVFQQLVPVQGIAPRQVERSREDLLRRDDLLRQGGD